MLTCAHSTFPVSYRFRPKKKTSFCIRMASFMTETSCQAVDNLSLITIQSVRDITFQISKTQTKHRLHCVARQSIDDLSSRQKGDESISSVHSPLFATRVQLVSDRAGDSNNDVGLVCSQAQNGESVRKRPHSRLEWGIDGPSNVTSQSVEPTSQFSSWRSSP
jgi:hypothetical protein